MVLFNVNGTYFHFQINSHNDVFWKNVESVDLFGWQW